MNGINFRKCCLNEWLKNPRVRQSPFRPPLERIGLQGKGDGEKGKKKEISITTSEKCQPIFVKHQFTINVCRGSACGWRNGINESITFKEKISFIRSGSRLFNNALIFERDKVTISGSGFRRNDSNSLRSLS